MAALVVSCRRIEQQLDPPFVSARTSWSRRTILAVELGTRAVHVGRGEASPLPGYSPDDIDACEHALVGLGGLGASASAEQALERVDAAVPEQLPAARFALQTAALDCLGRELRRPLWKLLIDVAGDDAGGSAPGELALCAVLPSDDPAGAVAAAKERLGMGVRAFKLKVGPGVLQPAQERTLEALRAALGASIELRVDANRTFSREALAETCKRLDRYRPSFVEEPIADPSPSELAQLPSGFALDESLVGASDERVRAWLGAPSCRALVLKPTLLGGFSRCLELARLARSHGRAVVVSHALEGPVGFTACVHLALAVPRGAAHGLWPLPHQLSASDVLSLTGFAAPGLGAP